MKLHLKLNIALVAATLLSPLVVHAATPMAKADHDAAKDRISASYKTDKATCDSLASNAKDVCIEEAKAKEKVGMAELTAGYSGKAADQNKALVAKAEAAYAVAKERCDDQAGNAKDVCVKEAKAVEVKALADAKMTQQIGTAKTDASADKRDADYKVALEKCDALAGDAKAGCVATAKVKFGKS